MGKNNIKYNKLKELKKYFKLNWDKIITDIPIKKTFSLWNLIKYLDFGSITKLAAIRAIIRV